MTAQIVRDHNNTEITIADISPRTEGTYTLSGAPLTADNRQWNLVGAKAGFDRIRLNGLLKRHYGVYSTTNRHVRNIAELLAEDVTA